MSEQIVRKCVKCDKQIELVHAKYLEGQTYCEQHYKEALATFGHKEEPSALIDLDWLRTGDAHAKRIRLFALAGLFVGVFLAFLLRPSAPLVGQLPFSVVITRGATLTGLDEMLKPMAARSFNITIGGAILGSIVGILIARGIGVSNQRQPTGPGTGTLTHHPEIREERECPHCAEPILVKAKVCKHCGRDASPAEAPANQAAAPDATPQ